MVPEVHARALKAKELYWPTYGLIGQLLGCFSLLQGINLPSGMVEPEIMPTGVCVCESILGRDVSGIP